MQQKHRAVLLGAFPFLLARPVQASGYASYPRESPCSISPGRREDPQAMAIRIHRHEGVAEIELDRLLQDAQPLLAPLLIKGVDGRRILDGEGEFTATCGRSRCRFHGIARPQPSIRPDGNAKRAKVGEVSTGIRPSRPA